VHPVETGDEVEKGASSEMQDDVVTDWPISRLSRAIRNREISPVEVTDQLLSRIDAANPTLNAYITVMTDAARASAAEAEREIGRGSWRGPLHGVPLGIKDMIETRGVRTTMGAAHFKDFVPTSNAVVVDRLIAAGAVIVGKHNTHQFAYGPTGDRSFFGPVKNPRDVTKMTGGSSSGSAAAVAAGLCFGAVGTDTGGSIRMPSAACGIVGMKPTYGRVSSVGVYPLSASLDHVGPMSRTVEDNALLLNELAGHGGENAQSTHPATEDFTRRLGESITGTVIGVPSSYFFERMDPDVAAKVRLALGVYESLGATLRPIDIPELEAIHHAQQTIIRCESFAQHRDMLRDFPDEYDKEVRERLLEGQSPTASDYLEARRVGPVATAVFARLLGEVDVIATPTLPIYPQDLQQREVLVDGELTQVRAAMTRFMGFANLTGLPGMSIPCGWSDAGLPAGLQLMGRANGEADLYRFAHAYEREGAVLNAPARPSNDLEAVAC
jgi:aspartyl-tRNA(Asn)/glutamyl-tRNA(Gln) amidotransferase subunit A